MAKYIRKFPDGYTRELVIENTNYLAYLYGLISTDGNLKSGREIIALTLHKRDINVLEWVRNLVMINPNIIWKCGANENSRGFSATLPKLYKQCLDLGLTPNKSLTLNVDLSLLPQESLIWFLRGVIDGDGTVYSRGVGFSGSSIRIFSSSLFFLKNIQDIYGGHITLARPNNSDILGVKVKSRKPSYILGFSGHCLRQFVYELPKEGFMVQRKTEKIELIIKQPLAANNTLYITFNNQTMNVKQWKEYFKSDVNLEIIRLRLRNGWAISDACLKPSKPSDQKKSKFSGVRRKNNRWDARLGHNKKRYHLGSFESEEDASCAYMEKAQELGLVKSKFRKWYKQEAEILV